GTPTRPPNVWLVACATGSPPRRLKHVLLLKLSCCMYSYKLNWNLFVPDRVATRICTGPPPDASAPALAVVSETSSTASRRGVMMENIPWLSNKLLVVTPSIVILMFEFVKPAMLVLLRGPSPAWPPVIWTPGRKTRKLIA